MTTATGKNIEIALDREGNTSDVFDFLPQYLSILKRQVRSLPDSLDPDSFDKNARQFYKLYSSEIKSATTCYWDKEKDRQVQLRWENKFMNVFVHLYALKTEY